MNIFNGIAELAGSLIGEPVKQWQKRKTLKVEHKFELERLNHAADVARAKATLSMAKNGQQQDFDLDKIAMRNMEKS